MITDINLSFLDPYFDVQIEDNDLETEEGLKTAVIISLYTDRRVTKEELPVEETDRRGCWTDALSNDQEGSKLWLLKREKITPQTIQRFQKYCEEALQWLVDDGVAQSVVVKTERAGLFQISIEIEILRPQDKGIRYSYAFVWNSIDRMAA